MLSLGLRDRKSFNQSIYYMANKNKKQVKIFTVINYKMTISSNNMLKSIKKRPYEGIPGYPAVIRLTQIREPKLCSSATIAKVVCLFCCFTSQVNSYGHGETVNSTNPTFSWARLNKHLTSTLCTYFHYPS